MRRHLKKPKINFVATKKRLLEVHVDCSVRMKEWSIYSLKTFLVYISVPIRKKINVREVEQYALDKMRRANLKRLKKEYADVVFIKAELHPFDVVFDLKGDL